MGSYLKYDTEKIADAQAKYQECFDKMGDIKENMQAIIDGMRDGWDTAAGDAFFKKYKSDWYVGFKQYQEVLAHMQGILKDAQKSYEAVTKRANSLKIE